MLEHVDTVLSFAVVMLLLSLLVTTVVQIVATALSLRSRILRKGIERLLTQVDSRLQDHAKTIATEVVRHPAVASGWRCTTALKKGELIQLLSDLASSSNSKLNANAKKLLNDAMQVMPLAQMDVLANTIQTHLTRVFSLASDSAQIKRIIDEARTRASEFGANVTAWFDTVMDRTTDEFRKWTRWITIGCALVLPFAFHVDSLQILRQLASDPELRAQVGQMTNATLDRAAQVFALTEESKGLASMALKLTCENQSEIAAIYEIKNVPDGFATRDQGARWIKEKLEKPKDPNHPKVLLATYNREFDGVAAVHLHGLTQCAEGIKASLDNSTLTIFELPDMSKGFWQHYKGWWREDGMHIWGALVTAVFLSLGAPFWYNTLKQLSNLRPAIAQKIDQASTKE